MIKKSKVYLVGAGPGDPGLITLKALDCLKKADTVIYDRLVNEKVLRFIPALAECIYAGKSSAEHTLTQEAINILLVKKAKQGKTVVRLKCGDPFLFGRGAEEALFLAKHKIPFEVVPGVSSAVAVPAYSGIPLTHRELTSSVGIFTGHENLSKNTSAIDWEKIATGLGTLVFLMGVENLGAIVKNLVASGRKKSTPCCLIQEGTLPQQKSVEATLGTIIEKAKKEHISPPAIFVVGQVVLLRKKMPWFEKKLLFGKKVLITRPQEGDENRLTQLLEEYGAGCIELPVARIKKLSNYSGLDCAIKNTDVFQWIIFTSQNGVRFFKQRLDYLKQDIRVLKGIKIAAIGPQTASALAGLGLRIDIEASTFCQEGLLERFHRIDLKGKNILLIRAQEARDILPKGIETLGAVVRIAPAYQTIQCTTHDTRGVTLHDIDIITFTSASCVQGFFKMFSKNAIFNRANKFKIASIGPITSQTARTLGLHVDIEAKQYTLSGLVEAMVKYYKAL